MNRASRAITLTLVGAAGLLLSGYGPCRQGNQSATSTRPAGTSHGYRPWYHPMFFGSGSSGGSSSGSSTAHGFTSRGGFGAHGHSAGDLNVERLRIEPRANWQRTVESQGFHFHTLDEVPYWDEGVYYRFSSGQIDLLEAATYALNEMCLAAVDHVIEQRLFDPFQIPPEFHPYVIDSWEREEFTIYGRFDLAYDGVNPPRLLEYNADTPTALLEAAVIQWFWFKDVYPLMDQFNSIHERLIEAWAAVRPELAQPVFFTSPAGSLEDFMTVNYLRDTAMQAGVQTEYIEVEQIGWNEQRRGFVDGGERLIASAFKLYPWEWMLNEEFGPRLLDRTTRWLEAPWKMLLSNKAILPILWELFPESPYLLEASFEPLAGSYVRKPLLAREGANVEIVENGRTVMSTEGDYPGPYVYQRFFPMRALDGHYPVIGSWMVNGYACGIGIREDSTPITQNTSRFVPHVFAH